jgi:tRNA U34 5-methylaminomethyl-2-thiouridine-forming methyltransferase MnmC
LRSNYEIVHLGNGSASVRSLTHGETFHPVVGPVAEAEALYVNQLALRERLLDSGELVVWDVGLGAAANPIVLLESLHGVPGQIQILSFDHTLDPLLFALDHAKELSYVTPYTALLRELAEKSDASLTNQNQEIRWRFFLGDFPAFLKSPSAQQIPKPDVILFDAFSPAKNPAMWTSSVFSEIFQLLDPNRPCTMPTYSRSTMLRVTLLLAGFYVGAGHATGEKEETTIAANSLALLKEPLGERWLRRARHSKSAEPLWEPVYRQAHLTEETWNKLLTHPQFAHIATSGLNSSLAQSLAATR